MWKQDENINGMSLHREETEDRALRCLYMWNLGQKRRNNKYYKGKGKGKKQENAVL